MLALNVNPTIDRQVFCGELVPGTVSRAERSHALPGGKPVDCARAALAHSVRAKIVQLLPQEHSEWFEERLALEGLAFHSIYYPGTIRETIVLYEHSGRATIINGRGADLPPQNWSDYCELVAELVKPGEWVICSGSFPPGVGAAQIAELFGAIRSAGGLVAADTGPAWLAAVMEQHPDLVSPNLSEARSWLAGRILPEAVSVASDVLPEALAVAQALVKAGVGRAIVSAAAAGLAWADVLGSGTVPALPVKLANPTGAGDALLGGTVVRLEAGDPFAEALLWGTATAASAISGWIPGGAVREQVAAFHDELVNK